MYHASEQRLLFLLPRCDRRNSLASANSHSRKPFKSNATGPTRRLLLVARKQVSLPAPTDIGGAHEPCVATMLIEVRHPVDHGVVSRLHPKRIALWC
jgi:hypothetical protein